MPLFSLSLFVAGVGAYLGLTFFSYLASNPLVMILSFILVLVFAFSRGALSRMSPYVSGMIVYAFSFLNGLLLSSIIGFYINSSGMIIVFEAFVITTFIFLVLYFVEGKINKDLGNMGRILLITLFAVIIASIVNIFIGGSMLFLLINIVSVVLFSGFILYDINQILLKYSDNDIYPAVMSLFLDFINLFIRILEILGLFSRRR